MLRHHHIPWPFDPNLELAANAGIDAPELNLREFVLYVCLCRIFLQTSSNFILLGSAAGSQVMSLRIDSVGSSNGISLGDTRSARMRRSSKAVPDPSAANTSNDFVTRWEVDR